MLWLWFCQNSPQNHGKNLENEHQKTSWSPKSWEVWFKWLSFSNLVCLASSRQVWTGFHASTINIPGPLVGGFNPVEKYESLVIKLDDFPRKGVNRKNIWNHHSDLISPHRAAAAMTHGSTINPLCRSKVFGFRITSWNSKPPKSTAMLKKCRNRGIHQVDSNWVSEVESINENNPYSANKPWNKSLNFRFPTKHVIPKSLKVGHG